MLLNYLVDVLGYSEDETKKEIAVYGIKEMLTPKQIKECISYSK